MKNECIDGQYREIRELYDYLMQNKEVSFAMDVQEHYKKILLLSAASLFESQISKIILDYSSYVSSGDERIVQLIKSKVIERQYHTLFDWKANNSNVFWKLYGEETKNKVRNEIDNNIELKKAEGNFMDLGKRRNLLVHENFSEYNMNITVDEIYKEYNSACTFVEYIRKILLSPKE